MKQAMYRQGRGEVLNEQPTNAWAWRNKGVALATQGRWKEALEAYEQALRLERKNAGIWRDKGWALENLKRWKEALEAYERALELDPHNAVERHPPCPKLKRGQE